MQTLAEQVAALEAKLDHMRKKYEDCRADLAVAESRLAAVSRPAEARGDDAVLRETLAEALDYAPSSQLAYLALAAGAGQTLDLNKIVDALLAAAPRPTQTAEG